MPSSLMKVVEEYNNKILLLLLLTIIIINDLAISWYCQGGEKLTL